MKVKICPADKVFSKYIRLRDGQCMRCKSRVKYNAKGDPVSHQASHYYGRVRESTRFDEENVDTLCMGCHKLWGSDFKEAYRNFMLMKLGETGFNKLTLRAYTTEKKDRKMALLYWRERYKQLKETRP